VLWQYSDVLNVVNNGEKDVLHLSSSKKAGEGLVLCFIIDLRQAENIFRDFNLMKPKSFDSIAAIFRYITVQNDTKSARNISPSLHSAVFSP
jgi:hypothetical protein